MAETPSLYPRHAETRVKEALTDTRVVALVGPRQCGKTTLAREVGSNTSVKDYVRGARITLQQVSRSTFVTFTDTRDAFRHLAQRAKERLVVMTPFIDSAGAAWAADLFETTTAPRRELVLWDSAQLRSAGHIGERLSLLATVIFPPPQRSSPSGRRPAAVGLRAPQSRDAPLTAPVFCLPSRPKD